MDRQQFSMQEVCRGNLVSALQEGVGGYGFCTPRGKPPLGVMNVELFVIYSVRLVLLALGKHRHPGNANRVSSIRKWLDGRFRREVAGRRSEYVAGA